MSKPLVKQDGTTTVIELPGVGIIFAAGITKPADTSSGYATGCYFAHIDGGDNTAAYVNEGTAASCTFNALTP